jgi:hypothetical protein
MPNIANTVEWGDYVVMVILNVIQKAIKNNNELGASVKRQKRKAKS